MKISRRTVVAVVVIGVFSEAFAIVEPSRPALANFDVRHREVIRPVPGEKRRAAARLREQAPQAQIDFDQITGSPKRISCASGFLTGPDGIGRAVSQESARAFRLEDAHRPTKAFLKEHKLLFGAGPEVLETARV